MVVEMAAKKRKPKIVSYTGADEVVICTADKEQEMLPVYFQPGNRDITHYIRREYVEGVVIVEATLKAR